jgi:23S rRNA-/tRNA-specific pseudouridylate synthase
VETFERASLIEVEPLTGRTHQIRVHLLAIGHPLLVDHQYGRAQPLETLARTPLHAWRLEVPALEGIAAARVEAPLPEDMARTVEALRRGT